ncbi:hypothetical protein B0T09DRAFT_345147, partial [Sordaria sp. MPI-SDFR-AT-0083]
SLVMLVMLVMLVSLATLVLLARSRPLACWLQEMTLQPPCFWSFFFSCHGPSISLLDFLYIQQMLLYLPCSPRT